MEMMTVKINNILKKTVIGLVRAGYAAYSTFDQ